METHLPCGEPTAPPVGDSSRPDHIYIQVPGSFTLILPILFAAVLILCGLAMIFGGPLWGQQAASAAAPPTTIIPWQSSRTISPSRHHREAIAQAIARKIRAQRAHDAFILTTRTYREVEAAEAYLLKLALQARKAQRLPDSCVLTLEGDWVCPAPQPLPSTRNP